MIRMNSERLSKRATSMAKAAAFELAGVAVTNCEPSKPLRAVLQASLSD
ncbi:MAG: hypothetical protein ACKVGZ_12715 [Alphaproteobacteria bacterium]|jgi:hypothetical protein